MNGYSRFMEIWRLQDVAMYTQLIVKSTNGSDDEMKNATKICIVEQLA